MVNTPPAPSSPDVIVSSPFGSTFSSPTANRKRSRLDTPQSQTRFASTPDDAPSSSPAPSSPGVPSVFLWGTRISVQDVNAAIVTFLRNFREHPLHDEGKYMKGINDVVEIEGEWLDVDANDVFEYDSDLYVKMVRYPLEVLAIFENVVMGIVTRIKPLFEKHVQARIFNLRTSTSMRNLNPSDIEKMVSLKGMVIRCGTPTPEIRESIFRCLVCGYYSDHTDRGLVSEPTMCMREECKTKNSMIMVHNRCRFANIQIISPRDT